jgi:hypothetical protein
VVFVHTIDDIFTGFLALFAQDHHAQAIDAVFGPVLFCGTPVLSLAPIHPRDPSQYTAPFFLEDEPSVFAEHELRAGLEALAGFHAPLEVETLSRPLEHLGVPGRVGVLRCRTRFPAAVLAISAEAEHASGVLCALAEPDGSVPVLWRALPHELNRTTASTVDALVRRVRG